MKEGSNNCFFNDKVVFHKMGIAPKRTSGSRVTFLMLVIICSLCALSSIYSTPVKAQGTAYVQIDGIPPILDSPLLTDFERNYRQGAYRIQFVFISPSRQPRSFFFRLSLEHNGEELIDMESSPVSYEPGVYSYATFDEDPAILFPLSYDEWLNQLNPELATTGILSEGDYLLKIEAIPTDPNTLIPTIPGVALFTVRYAEPPLLLSPPDEATIPAQLPIFSWTPITGTPPGSTIEYELLITEILAGQTPAQALESNIEQAHKALVEQTSFVYTPTELPLVPGKLYAWQVQAQDINSQLPILDRGATEIYTFSIASEGLGTGLTAWSFPINSPFLRHDFRNEEELDPNDTELFFDDYLPIDILGIQSNATFDNILIDVETQRIIEGVILLEDAFALEVAINPLNDSFTGYEAVLPGSELSLTDGLLLNLGDDIQISADGLQPKGTHPATISYSGYGVEQWTATYSEDLVIDFSPFNIIRGRIDFAAEGIAKGYADVSGFYLESQIDPVIAQLPDRLLIQHGELGYIPLKNGNNALVNLEEQDNLFKLVPAPGAELELILPALQQDQRSKPARFSATLDNVIIDAATGSLVEGMITSSLRDSSTNYSLDPLGIPVAPREVHIKKEKETTNVEIKGLATVWGKPIQNSPLISFILDPDQILRANIALDSLNGFVWLDENTHSAKLSISSLEGQIEAPLVTSGTAFRYNVKGTLDFLSASDLAAQADVAFSYTGAGYVAFDKITPISLPSPNSFGYNNHEVIVNEITGLDFYYSISNGLTYTATAEAYLETALRQSNKLRSHLVGTELTHTSIIIPAQEVHSGAPHFTPSFFEQGNNHFELVATRIPATVLPYSNQENEQNGTLEPRFDFELRLSSNDAFTNTPLTVQNASVEGGFITGPILPYSFLTPARWQLDVGTYYISSIAGILHEEEGIQSQDLVYTGDLSLNAIPGLHSCDSIPFGLRQSKSTIVGNSPSFTPCSPIESSGYSLDMGQSQLSVQWLGDRPSFLLEGELLNIARANGSTSRLESPGEITINLSESAILSAQAQLESIELQVPTGSSLLDIELNDVSLTDLGFELSNESTVSAISHADGQQFEFQTDDQFIFGWQPTRSNIGRGELIIPLEEGVEVAAYFDNAGFHKESLAGATELPAQIRLPDLIDSYLILAQDEEATAQKSTRQGIEITTDEDQQAYLAIPLFENRSEDLLFPVSADVLVNEAFAFLNGSVSGDYEDNPIDLSSYGLPIRITGIEYASVNPVGRRILLSAEIENPFTESNPSSDLLEYIPFSATVGPNGFTGTPTESAEVSLYPEVLNLIIDNIYVDESLEDSKTFGFVGEISSPFISSTDRNSKVGINGTYSQETGDWTYALSDHLPEKLSIGTSVFHADPSYSYSIVANPGLALSITGRFQFPELLDPGFSLGAIIDIGSSGIVIWPNDDLWTPQPLFGGILSTRIEAFDVTYDQENNAVLTTLDGAFTTQLVSSDDQENLIPFSGIQISSEGYVSIRGNHQNLPDSVSSQTESQDLLTNLSPIQLIDNSYIIDSLELINDSTGLSLNLRGNVYLPNYESYTPGFRLPKLSTPIPVSVQIGHDGRVIESDMYRNTALLDSLGIAGTTPSVNYTAFDLDFNPKNPSKTKILASASLIFEDIAEQQEVTFVDSTLNQIDSTRPAILDKGIFFGSPSNPSSHPGIIISEQNPISYLITNSPDLDRYFFTIKGNLTDIQATNISLSSSTEPIFTLSGRSFLNLDGFSGFMPVENLIIDPRGISDLGSLSAPSAIAYKNLASFELNCLDHSQNSVSYLQKSKDPSYKPTTATQAITPVDGPFEAQIRFGKFCGSSLPLTVTDRWFSGTFDEFSLQSDTFSSPSLQVNGIELGLSRLASFQGTLTYDNQSGTSYFQVDGDAYYKGIELTGTGSLKLRNGLPSLSILFSPARRPLEIIPDHGYARISGGGLFYRPTDSELELVSLAIDERSNNNFSSNYPGIPPTARLTNEDQLSFIAPIEFTLESGRSTLDFNGVGILQHSEQLAYLDLDGAFFDSEENLQSDLFLVAQNELPGDQEDASVSLEGLANISLNYTSIIGGVVPANLSLNYQPDAAPIWSALGYSSFILTDTIELPGALLLNQNGFTLSLEEDLNISKGHVSVDDLFQVSLWQERDNPDVQGYVTFNSSVDLLPGYMLNRERMYGALIKDRDEYQIYAARNQYADVPFVFNGALDPWLAFQDGDLFTGDARNSAFRRMIQDARISSQRISGLTEEATSTLQQVLDLQASIAASPVLVKDMSSFAQADLITDLGERVLRIGSNHISPEEMPSELASIKEQLFQDENHPGFNYRAGQAFASDSAGQAFDQMRSSIAQARRSAELDIYSFQTISPRPLLWLPDHINLSPDLVQSPLEIDDIAKELNPNIVDFSIEGAVATNQANSLIAFKQGNEALDTQFMRAVGGLEVNLVNLKTARTPEQAFDFEIANNSIRQFYTQQIADDWRMLDWSTQKKNWLESQRATIQDGIQEQLSAFSKLDESSPILRGLAKEQYDLARDVARHTSWERSDLPEGTQYAQYINELPEDQLASEYVQSAMHLWYDAPLASLTTLSDSLSALIQTRIDQFAAHSDSLRKVSDSFSKALDPLYDVQTQYTTTLFGMADEYRIWRSSIRGLDPDAVNYAFQFNPYRGDYRILAEDLTPPVIGDIVVVPSTEGYHNRSTISWETDHPVELAEISLSISEDTSSATYFTSLATSTSTSYFATKTAPDKEEADISLTLRVRGAGGVPVLKKGQFSVPVSPDGPGNSEEEITLTPLDRTPPPSPVIANLAYSSYFSETPNTLQFYIGPLRDPDSGIERVEYKVESNDGKNLLQDWTSLPISTTYFGGRLVETSLPAQEDEITIRVSVRITNGSSLTSLTSQELDLNLDVTPPSSTIKQVLYYDAFELTNPNSLGIELVDIQDEESGIEKVEYTITQEAQANLANAIWSEFIPITNRSKATGTQTVYIPLDARFVSEASNNVSVFLRATNGAGLQNVIRETVQIPGSDLSAPSEPLVSLEHTGFYAPEKPNHLRVIVSNSSDLESGIDEVLFRVIDGQTGQLIYDWDNFVLINPAYPTFIIPTTEKLIPLPDFASSRSIIVEVQTTNRAGLVSTKAVRFLPVELDVTPPTRPQLSAAYYSSKSPSHPNSIVLDIGHIEDPESPITAVEYRVLGLDNQQNNPLWIQLDLPQTKTHFFTGRTVIIPDPVFAPNENPFIQVRSTNQQGLSNSVDYSLTIERDFTAPIRPSLRLSYEEQAENEQSLLTIQIGESYDPQTSISTIRYRISDLLQSDSLIVNWENIDLNYPVSVFEGISIQEEIPPLQAGARYLIDVEVLNGAGIAARSSSIVDAAFFNDITEESRVPASLDLFYFAPSNSIRSNELELTILPEHNYASPFDSMEYKIEFAGVIEQADSSTAEKQLGIWNSVNVPTPDSFGRYRLYATLPPVTDAVSGQVEVRLYSETQQIASLNQSFFLSSMEDQSPPAVSDINAIYFGAHHPTRANQLELVLNHIVDMQTRISDIEYRISNQEGESILEAEWNPIAVNANTGLFTPSAVTLNLPDFPESTILNAEIRSTNGDGLQTISSIPVSVIIDTTPPVFEEPNIFVERSAGRGNRDLLQLHVLGLSDIESNIESLEYSIKFKGDSTYVLKDWSSIPIPRTNIVRPPEIAIPLPATEDDYSVITELKATNSAGLIASYSREIKQDIDATPPQLQQINGTYRLTQSGSGYLLIEPGSFRDPESQIERIEYRLLDATDASSIYIPWTSIPVQKDIRVQVSPITIPRQLLNFDATRSVIIEFKATNGEGNSATQQTIIEIPGDTTRPDTPSLLATHRNGYDPRHPNTIEIQIGPSKDDQSLISRARYRVINLASRAELLSWTDLPVSNDGVFPGKVLFVELPFLSQDLDMQVEVEVTNSASLVRSVSETVTIQVSGDLTPPALEISTHYFSNTIAIILDELSDSHSRIQKIEYRLVDNVDQTVLSDWQDLFEVVNPQPEYSRRSYRFTPPSVRDGRAVKVEVRATNGAGLQSTTSKTVLYRQAESN